MEGIRSNIEKQLFLPWKIIVFYLIGCFSLYLVGPWKYRYEIDFRMILLLGVFGISSTWVYKREVRTYIRKNKIIQLPPRRGCGVSIGWLNFLIVAAFVSGATMLFIKVLQNGLPNMSSIFRVMANAYSTTRSSELGIDQAMRVFYRTAVFFYLAIPVGLFEFRNLRGIYKTLLIISIFELFIYTVMYSGQQKQIGDIAILILSVLIIRFEPRRLGTLSKKQFVVVFFFVLAVVLFSSILSGRLIMMNMTVAHSSTWHYSLDGDSIIFKILPENAALGLAYFIFYLSHGFYGLNLCVQQPFIWAKGLGSNSVLVTLLEQFARLDASSIPTYPFRAQLVTGWSATSVWHTIFPWLASDLTFPGSIVYLCFGAYIYAKCWCEIKYERTWQSVFLFSMLNIQWFYMVANNQIFTSKGTFTVFIIALILWIFRKSRIRFF